MIFREAIPPPTGAGCNKQRHERMLDVSMFFGPLTLNLGGKWVYSTFYMALPASNRVIIKWPILYPTSEGVRTL